jgi:hypothetical protein
LILSSLPHDKINNKPHHNIKTIEKIHAANTNKDIHNNTNSPKSIVGPNNEACSL